MTKEQLLHCKKLIKQGKSEEVNKILEKLVGNKISKRFLMADILNKKLIPIEDYKTDPINPVIPKIANTGSCCRGK